MISLLYMPACHCMLQQLAALLLALPAQAYSSAGAATLNMATSRSDFFTHFTDR